MLDSKILRLSEGTFFKAKVEFCNVGTMPYIMGIRDGQIVDCERLHGNCIEVNLPEQTLIFGHICSGMLLKLHEV